MTTIKTFQVLEDKITGIKTMNPKSDTHMYIKGKPKFSFSNYAGVQLYNTVFKKVR